MPAIPLQQLPTRLDTLVSILLFAGKRNSCLVVPWEEVNHTDVKPESPPPTFATATATASLLTDRREVINDTSQDIWNEDMDFNNGSPSRPGTPAAESGLMTPTHSAPSVGQPVGQLRTRIPHGQPGDTIEMISAPVARRG